MFIRTGILLAVMTLAGAAAASAQQAANGPAQDGGRSGAAGEQVKPRFAVEISTVGDKFLRKPKSSYRVGEGVFVLLSMTNTTGEDVTIAAGDPFSHLRMSLTRDGEKVHFNKKTLDRMAPRAEESASLNTTVDVTLKPYTNTPMEVIDLADWFDTLEPGTYQLTVWRVWGKGHKSNAVTFEVTP